MNNKTVNFPQKSNAEKTAEALKALAGLQNAVPRMVQIPADKYEHLVRATLQRDLIAEGLNAFPEYMIPTFVRTVLGCSKENADATETPVTSEGNADA